MLLSRLIVIATVVGAGVSVIAVSAEQHRAKPDNGKIAGRLYDPECKSVVAKAVITIKGVKFKRKIKSDAAGNFETSVAPGVYTLSVEKLGFKRHIVRDINVTSGSTSTVNLDLQPGWPSDDPTVGDQPPPCTPPNKSLHASRGNVFRNLIRPAMLD